MIYLLDGADPRTPFPEPAGAEREPNGLLAIGGDLTPMRLLNAYRRGIFPWFASGQPILWWSPDPRMVLYPADLRVSRSLRKTLRQGRYAVSMDQAFGQVINACAAPRCNATGTWLVPQMIAAYEQLHRLGFAHSVETWQDQRLVGGLYGVVLGRVFFGESMFSHAADASKVALAVLVARLRRQGFRLLDCQVYTAHLDSLGARTVPRAEFQTMVDSEAAAAPGTLGWPQPPRQTCWPFEPE